MTTNRCLTLAHPSRLWPARRPSRISWACRRAGAATLGLLGVLAGACGGNSRSAMVQSPALAPTLDNCTGSIELLVENKTPLRVRVLELSELGVTRVLGEMSGRGTQTFEIRDHAGMTYTVVEDETGELLATEAGHPRGEMSNGATVSRACVVKPG